MKTSVIMIRGFGDHGIRQETKHGMFNANDLLNAWNSQAPKGKKKRMQSFFNRKETKELVEELLLQLNKDDSTNSCYLPEHIVKTSKDMKSDRGGTWMHPYIYMEFAMWLSIKYKLVCIAWMYDHLIQLRKDVGDDYKEFTSAIKEYLQPTDVATYKNEIGMINKLVFGTMDAGQRQLATESQLALLKTLQKADMKLMAEGKDYSQRMTSLYRLKQLL
jgi:hypothetical protein